MADTVFKNFGELYRGAFAEPDAERKTVLLSQVKRALDNWEHDSLNRSVATQPGQVLPQLPPN
jgi:hypothetical protein